VQHIAKTISIVTPSLNQGEFIAETIESVLSQAGNFYIDYIVMDGCSTDGSVEIIARYARFLREAKWPVQCLGINYRWICEPDNGQADALNKGFGIAGGDILGWINSDDAYYPGAFQKVAAVNWDRVDFCFGKGMWLSREGKELCPYPTFKPNRYSLSGKCTLCQPTVFFSKKAYLKLGGLSQEYYCTFDYEYWLRAVFQAQKFSFVPAFLAKSRMYPQNKSLSDQLRATREAAVIRHRYYSGQRLNKMLCRYYSMIVENVTRRREDKLFKEIESWNR